MTYAMESPRKGLTAQDIRFAVAPMMDWAERSFITRSCMVPCANFAHARSAFLSCSFLRGASIPPAGLRQSARAHSTTVEFAPACPQWRLTECRGDLHALGMPPVAMRVWGDLQRRLRHTATKVAQFKILKSTSSGHRKSLSRRLIQRNRRFAALRSAEMVVSLHRSLSRGNGPF